MEIRAGTWDSKHIERLRGDLRYAKTPSDRLRALFESQINAKALLERLTVVPDTDSMESALLRMAESEFDVIGVQSADGVTYGYVERGVSRKGICRDHARPFLSGDLISDSAPLIEVIAVLRNRAWVFVLGGPSVFGIITRADLQKAPVRVMAFGLVSTLEMQVTEILRESLAQTNWESLLSQGRLQATRKIFKQRLAQNEQISLFDCLQLCDKRDLLCSRDELREKLHFDSKKSCQRFFKRVERLRNQVAHGQDMACGKDWPDVIDLLQEVDFVLQELSKSRARVSEGK